MRAGQLNRTITIQRQTETIAPSGSVSSAWTNIATLAAEIVQQSATEFLTGFGEAESGTVVFRIRYRSGITTADRVVYNGQPHDVKELKEIGRRRGLEIRAVAIS